MMKLLYRPYGFILFVLFLLGPMTLSPKLEAQDFRQECGQIPSDVFLMLDRTGSVSDEERTKEAEAAKTLVRLLLEQTTNQVAVGAFGSEKCLSGYPATLLAPLGEQEDELFQAIDAGMVNSSCGGTNLRDPLQLAGEVLDQGHNPNRVFILISDGDPNYPNEGPGPRQLAIEAAENLKDEGIRVFTIAFDATLYNDETNRQTLATMASNASQDDSEGEVDAQEQTQENQDEDDFFIAPRAADLERVFRNIGEIILCDDQDPCTEDRCNDQRRCEYVIKDACLADSSHEDSDSCGGDSCPSQGIQETEASADQVPLHQTPTLPNPGPQAMVQGGGMACALETGGSHQDLGAILVGLISLLGSLILLRRHA